VVVPIDPPGRCLRADTIAFMDLPGIAIRLSFVAMSCMMSIGGCSGKSGPPLAAGSRTAYTTDQSKAALVAMQSILVGATNSSASISLVPAHGIRWSDLPKAISQAGAEKGIEVALAGSSKVGIATRYELLTIEGWPGVLQAAPQGTGIVMVASIGPYPDQPVARDRAARLVQLTHQRLLALGRLPKIEPYTVE